MTVKRMDNVGIVVEDIDADVVHTLDCHDVSLASNRCVERALKSVATRVRGSNADGRSARTHGWSSFATGRC